MITVQVENFRAVMPELATIFPTHWENLALFKDRMPLAPQYGEYIMREQAGTLMLVTVRRDGRIVAYYTANIRPGFHYDRTLTGTMDMMFVVPDEPAPGMVALPLMRKVETELRRRGVDIWYSGYKTDKAKGMARLHELFGFQPADTYTAKWIGKTS